MKLAANNNKDWFDANRKQYQDAVKKPFEAFVEALIEKLKDRYSLGVLSASDCIFRINRDIRFSKDKTPYKIQMSALIAKGGRKNMHSQALYIELGPEFLNVYTGDYMPERDRIQSIREKMANHEKAFKAIISARKFKEFFGEVHGDKSKIIPKELKEAAARNELIYNKQFYLTHSADAELILDPGLLDYVVKVYAAADEYNDFIFK